MSGPSLAEKRKRKRSDYGFHLEYRTRWSDNDMYAHMNNSVYSFLFDSIINAYLIAHCGLTPASTTPSASASQVGLVVSSYCDYFGSVAFPAVLELGLRVMKLGKSSVLYEVGVFEQGVEQVKAVGGYVHVFVAREGMKPEKAGMRDEVRRGVERLLVEGEEVKGSGEVKAKI